MAKSNNILIIIDPWERTLITKILFFVSDQYWLFKRIGKFISDNLDTFHTIVIAAYDNVPVDKIVQQYPGNKIYATTIEEIAPIIKNNKIKNIYFAGSAWNKCVRHRELGYLNVRKFFKKLNLLVKDDCVIYCEEHRAKIFDPVDNLDWSKTNKHGIFQYVK